MFDKVLAPELIPSVLEKFIRVYMREHDLQEEELLLLYIEVTSPLHLVFFLGSTQCAIVLNVYYSVLDFAVYNARVCLCIESVTLESNNDICMQNNTFYNTKTRSKYK